MHCTNKLAPISRRRRFDSLCVPNEVTEHTGSHTSSLRLVPTFLLHESKTVVVGGLAGVVCVLVVSSVWPDMALVLVYLVRVQDCPF